jgi:hypothetical protein
MPPYWTSIASRWEIRLDSTAPSRPNVFAQLPTRGSEAEASLAVFDKVVCRDGELSVKFKIARSGPSAGVAGIVLRYQDPRDYYVLRFSAEDKNISLIRVLGGVARPVPVTGEKPGATSVPHDIRAGQWYAAKVIYQGTHFRVLFGNRRLFDAEDDGIPVAGKTGLRTRTGTAVQFDDFRIARKS